MRTESLNLRKQIVTIFGRLTQNDRRFGMHHGIQITLAEKHPTAVALTLGDDPITRRFYSLHAFADLLEHTDIYQPRQLCETQILIETLWECISTYGLSESRTDQDAIANELEHRVKRGWLLVHNCSRPEQLDMIEKRDLLHNIGCGQHRLRPFCSNPNGDLGFYIVNNNGPYLGKSPMIQSRQLLDFVQMLVGHARVQFTRFGLCPTMMSAAYDVAQLLEEEFRVSLQPTHQDDRRIARTLLKTSGLPDSLLSNL